MNDNILAMFRSYISHTDQKREVVSRLKTINNILKEYEASVKDVMASVNNGELKVDTRTVKIIEKSKAVTLSSELIGESYVDFMKTVKNRHDITQLDGIEFANHMDAFRKGKKKGVQVKIRSIQIVP